MNFFNTSALRYIYYIILAVKWLLLGFKVTSVTVLWFSSRMVDKHIIDTINKNILYLREEGDYLRSYYL